MRNADAGLGEIAQAALGRRDLSALESMLRNVAAMCNAFGVALFQVRIEDKRDGVREISAESRPAKQNDIAESAAERVKLFVLAHGFLDENTTCAYHNLPLRSATGSAAIQEEYESADCENDPVVDKTGEFYKRSKPGSLFALRVNFEDETVGVLTVFWRHPGRFSEDTKHKLALIAKYNLPTFYSAILDRVSYRLVEATSASLDQADEEKPSEVMQEIVETIAEILRCKEASIFLEDSLAQRGEFQCVATSCEALLSRKSFAINDGGFTPLVAGEQRAVLILDLRFLSADMSERAQFNGGAFLEPRVKKLLGIDVNGECPPISFVAVPILAGGNCVGVLRCQLRPRTPNYFSEAEVDLLRIIAARIGSFWSRHLRERESKLTTELWETFVDELNKLEMHLRDLSAKSKRAQVNRTFQEEIFSQGLSALEKSIPGSDILDVALVDANRKLIKALVIRDREKGASQKAPEKRLELPLHPANHNTWSHIFHNYQFHKNLFIEDTTEPGDIPYLAIYPDVKQALFTPIIADNQCIGILSIRSKSFFRNPEKAKRMASLVALQVGLYHQLTTLLSQQARTYQDLAHQLRTPVFQARKRLRWLVEKSTEATYDLLSINGLLAKTQRVLSNMQLYEDLAFERPIAIKKEENSIDALTKLIIEGCADNKVLWRSRDIKFTLDRDSFQKTRLKDLRYDSTLLEQVISNLFDNAGKYSQKGSEVVVAAHLDQDRRLFEITAKSKAGVTIDQKDISFLGERGFRSEMAKRRTAEGSGIGLFLVKQIMLAHKGDLRIAETDPIGYNRVTVTLPL